MSRSTVFFGCGLFAVLTALASPAFAGDVASEFGLGDIHRFDNEEAARTHCRGDVVVWADRKTGFYYPKFAPEYGANQTGSFTCYKEAKDADYWGFGGGVEAAGSRNGRDFPLIPGPVCDWRVDKKTGKGFCAQPGS